MCNNLYFLQKSNATLLKKKPEVAPGAFFKKKKKTEQEVSL